MKSLFTHLPLVFIHIGIGQGSMAKGFGNEYRLGSKIDAGYSVNTINDFGIIGSEVLCLYYGSITGEFFWGGLASDVFK